MERLRMDVPTFFSHSRIISVENKEWWNNFFSQAIKTLSTVVSTNNDKPTTWLLDELKFLKFGHASNIERDLETQPAERTETRTNELQFYDPLIPNEVSEEITVMVENQLLDIPEVSNYVFLYFCVSV